jgi:23S rRNA (adenine1618-N6)-methyltransferase
MSEPKKEHPKEKATMHARNKHRERYDLPLLMAAMPELAPFVKVNTYGDESIDFFNPEAVKTLNKALLKQYYGVENWDIPAGYLCPPIPGRADYIHHIADLLYGKWYGSAMPGARITCLDLGVGANCVYPIIGNREYGWQFIGADIDPKAIASARKIVEANPVLAGQIELRLQHNARDFFRGILQPDERVDLTICNPPFHASAADAQSGTMRKLKNLKQAKSAQPVLNFGGQNNELWCEGGEARFVRDMIFQSRQFGTSCFWFSTLISKQTNLKSAYSVLKKVEAVEVKTIEMGQGNKTSRFVAWTFLNREAQEQWMRERWQ